MDLKFRGVTYRVSKMDDTDLYNIVSEDGLRVIYKDMEYEDVVKRFREVERKVSLIEYEGFELKDCIELTNGFKRVQYMHKEFDYCVNVYIFKTKEWNIMANRRFRGKDYTVEYNDMKLVNITNDIIVKAINDVNEKVGMHIDE